MKVLSYWNVSSQLRINSENGAISSVVKVSYMKDYILFFTFVEANVFSVF